MFANPIAEFLQKSPQDFQRSDLIEYISKHDIHTIQLRYPGLDGRLKSLQFPLTSPERSEQILGAGERVDGSSLFKSILDPAKSDLYVVPLYETAFLNPIMPGVLDICCRYLDQKRRAGAIYPFEHID